MFAPLATTMLIALLVSLVVALTVSPGPLGDCCSSRPPRRSSASCGASTQGYLRLLGRAVRHPRGRSAIGAAVLVVAGGARPADRHRVHAAARRGLHRHQRRAAAERLARRLGEGRELHGEAAARVPGGRDGRVSKTGRAEISEDPMGPEQTDVFVMLKPRRAWRPGATRPSWSRPCSRSSPRSPACATRSRSRSRCA